MIQNYQNLFYVKILTIIVLIISLIGYFSQYRISRHKKNFYTFDDKFLVFNGFTCFFICIYTFLINDILLFFYNGSLLLFYAFIYINKYYIQS